MGGVGSKPLAYYGPDGNLYSYKQKSRHDGKKEFQFVSAHDGPLREGEECYLINASWLDSWLSFVQATSPVPKIINNDALVKIRGVEPNLILEMRANIKPKIDFRPIKKEVWQYLFTLYGGGPVLVIFVPTGLSERQYQAGTWIKQTDFINLTTIIIPSSNPGPFKQRPPPPTAEEQLAAANLSIAAGAMMKDLGKSKMQQAKALDGQISQAAADGIGAHMVRDLGKKKMEEANKLSGDINSANADLAASLFAADLSKKALAEAKEKEEAQNKAAMESAANIMGSAVSSQKLKDAQIAKAKAEQEQTRNLMESMKRMGAKTRFFEAKKSGLKDVMLDAAACMLQSTWRAKLAHRVMQKQREYRQRLREDGYARKLQCSYRARLARKRMDKLRAEKQRLKEYAYARKLQGAWRAKKARARVAQLKAERQRLREEGCALILQSSWRIKLARRKMEAMKQERQRLREEGCALMLQSAWRIRQAKAKVGDMRIKRDLELKRKREEEERRLQKATAVVAINIMRLIARQRLRKRVSESPQVLVVTLHSAAGLAAADITGTSDPYVFVAGIASNGHTVSLFKSQYKARTLSPVWEEDSFVCNVTGRDSVVLTVVDHDMVGSHDFLGQVEIPLKSCMRVFSGATVTKTLDLTGYRRQIADGTGKPIKIDSTDSAGGGKITVSLKLCSSSVSHSGPIMKQAASVIGFMKRAGDGGFKRRFMLLTAQSLMYFDDVFTLDAPRNTLLQSDIEAISEENNTLNIVAHNSKESWTMAWVEGEAAAQKKAWLQKLHRFGDRSHAQTGISKAASTVKKSKRRSVFGL